LAEANYSSTLTKNNHRPRTRHLEKRAKRVANHLEKHLPNERNVAVYHFEPVLIKKGFLRKRYDLGTGTHHHSFFFFVKQILIIY